MDDDRNPDTVDEWRQAVVKEHRPAHQKSQISVQTLPHIGVGGARRRVDCGHSAVTEGRDQHGEHREEEGGYVVAVREFLGNSKQRYRSYGLRQDNAVEDQIPDREDSP